jgi:hypothetical protein
MIIRPIYSRLGLSEREILLKQISDAIETEEVFLDIDGTHSLEIGQFLVEEIVPLLVTKYLIVQSHSMKRLKVVAKIFEKRGILCEAPYSMDDRMYCLKLRSI